MEPGRSTFDPDLDLQAPRPIVDSIEPVEERQRLVANPFLAVLAWLVAFGVAQRVHETPEPGPVHDRVACCSWPSSSSVPLPRLRRDGLAASLLGPCLPGGRRSPAEPGWSGDFAGRGSSYSLSPGSSS